MWVCPFVEGIIFWWLYMFSRSPPQKSQTIFGHYFSIVFFLQENQNEKTKNHFSGIYGHSFWVLGFFLKARRKTTPIFGHLEKDELRGHVTEALPVSTAHGAWHLRRGEKETFGPIGRYSGPRVGVKGFKGGIYP